MRGLTWGSIFRVISGLRREVFTTEGTEGGKKREWAIADNGPMSRKMLL